MRVSNVQFLYSKNITFAKKAEKPQQNTSAQVPQIRSEEQTVTSKLSSFLIKLLNVNNKNQEESPIDITNIKYNNGIAFLNGKKYTGNYTVDFNSGKKALLNYKDGYINYSKIYSSADQEIKFLIFEKDKKGFPVKKSETVLNKGFTDTEYTCYQNGKKYYRMTKYANGENLVNYFDKEGFVEQAGSISDFDNKLLSYIKEDNNDINAVNALIETIKENQAAL